uniref:Uncharacterized protein n=1 Tax=Avena sativa TaxID=4498 RepID=A0ACD5Y088_AVESA
MGRDKEIHVEQMTKKTRMKATKSANKLSPDGYYDFLVKILVVGVTGVGKSNLLSRFVEDTFSTSYFCTFCNDLKIRTIELDGKWIKLQLWDTPGHERFRTRTPVDYREAKGILLVYDVNDELSFNNIRTWKKIIELHVPEANMILVGNKADMDECKRVVTTSRGQALADEYRIKFFETSAKMNLNVEQALFSLTREIIPRLATKTDGIPKDPAPVIKQWYRSMLAFARGLFLKKK